MDDATDDGDDTDGDGDEHDDEDDEDVEADVATCVLLNVDFGDVEARSLCCWRTTTMRGRPSRKAAKTEAGEPMGAKTPCSHFCQQPLTVQMISF